MRLEQLIQVFPQSSVLRGALQYFDLLGVRHERKDMFKCLLAITLLVELVQQTSRTLSVDYFLALVALGVGR